MEAYKVAAMFKAGGVAARRRRRALLCILRNQFGKKAFAPEYQVDILCEGHSKVHVDKIEYQYEFGAVPETLNYYEKNIANETEVQLRVRIGILSTLMFNYLYL